MSPFPDRSPLTVSEDDHPRINSLADAEAFCAMVEQRLDAVEAVIREETDRLAEARLRDAFALRTRKMEATESYHRDLLTFKRNAVALKRFHPPTLDRLKARQGQFETVVDANLKVLQLLSRASEDLIRSLADDVEAPRRLDVYNQSGTRYADRGRAKPGPIAISKKS